MQEKRSQGGNVSISTYAIIVLLSYKLWFPYVDLRTGVLMYHFHFVDLPPQLRLADKC